MAMQCIIHPERIAGARCSGCAEALCPNCLVEVAGGAYCQQCKSMAVKTPPVVLGKMETASQARASVIVGLVGVLFLTIIFGIAALIMGIKSWNEIKANPRLCGEGMALAGICLGSIDILLFVLNMANKH